MRIKGISELFFKPVQRVPAVNREPLELKYAQEAQVDPGAVKIAANFGKSSDALSQDEIRQRRISELKSRVENGDYKADSKQVAVAFAKELLV